MIFDDAEFQIAIEKARDMKAEIQKWQGLLGLNRQDYRRVWGG